MRSLYLSLACAALLLTGCAADGSFKNPFESEGEQPASGASSANLTGEFTDVPVPATMDITSDTFVTVGQGIKTGSQKFRGRMESVDLMNAMRRNMAGHGWVLRSAQRSQESILVFEKPDRVCTLHFSEGLIFTDMTVFVSSRLTGDKGGVDLAAPASRGSAGSGGKASSSSGGVQKLSQ